MRVERRLSDFSEEGLTRRTKSQALDEMRKSRNVVESECGIWVEIPLIEVN